VISSTFLNNSAVDPNGLLSGDWCAEKHPREIRHGYGSSNPEAFPSAPMLGNMRVNAVPLAPEENRSLDVAAHQVQKITESQRVADDRFRGITILTPKDAWTAAKRRHSHLATMDN
jgi:hypothetical protein